jgi:hypothetical protein
LSVETAVVVVASVLAMNDWKCWKLIIFVFDGSYKYMPTTASVVN